MLCVCVFVCKRRVPRICEPAKWAPAVIVPLGWFPVWLEFNEAARSSLAAAACGRTHEAHTVQERRHHQSLACFAQPANQYN